MRRRRESCPPPNTSRHSDRGIYSPDTGLSSGGSSRRCSHGGRRTSSPPRPSRCKWRWQNMAPTSTAECLGHRGCPPSPPRTHTAKLSHRSRARSRGKPHTGRSSPLAIPVCTCTFLPSHKIHSLCCIRGCTPILLCCQSRPELRPKLQGDAS